MADEQEFEKVSKEIFEGFDCDKSGYIDCKEFEAAIRKYNEVKKAKLTDQQMKEAAQDFIKTVDQDADGKVSYKEFCDLLRYLCKADK